MRYFCCQEDRRRTGRYVAGGTALAVMLLGLHHLFLRGASTIAGVCVPAIIMASYIIWVLYSARRDRRKVNARTRIVVVVLLLLLFTTIRSGRTWYCGIARSTRADHKFRDAFSINADETCTNNRASFEMRPVLKINGYNLMLRAVDIFRIFISLPFTFTCSVHLSANGVPRGN